VAGLARKAWLWLNHTMPEEAAEGLTDLMRTVAGRLGEAKMYEM